MLIRVSSVAVLCVALVCLAPVSAHPAPEGVDVVVLIDDSLSMGEADAYPADKELRAAAEALAGKGATRLALAQALLTRADGGWLAALAGRGYRLHLYHFDAQGRAERLCAIADPKNKDQLKAAVEKVRGLRSHAEATRLGDAVRAILGDFRGNPLAAVVVLSDGITTEGEGLAQIARRAAALDVPLFPVMLGDPRVRPAVGIVEVNYEEMVTVGDRLTLDVVLVGRGLKAEVEVRLEVRDKSKDQVVSSQRVRLHAEQFTRVRSTFAVTDAGERTYVIELTAPVEAAGPGEERRREIAVQVREERRARVLLIEGGPGFEQRTRFNLLSRMKGVDVRLLLQDADPGAVRERPELLAELPKREELRSYDVVLFGDVDPKGSGLGDQALRTLADYVRDGGGLLVQPGPRYGLHALKGTPLAEVLPVEITSEKPPDDVERTEGFRPMLTPVGRAHALFRFSPDEKENEEIWNRLRELYWHAEGFQVRKTAEVLAVHPKGGRDRQPLIVKQYVGEGRCLLLGVNETWRWAWREDVQVYNQFWTQTVRSLASRSVGRLELRLGRQTAYRLGEPIKVTLRFPDDAPAPEEGLAVRVRVEHRPEKGDAGPPTELRLAKVEGARAIFEAVLVPKMSGEHRFVLIEPRQDKPVVRAAKVLPPPGERDQLRANEVELRQAAEESRGRAYDLKDAAKLPDGLPRR